MVAQDGVNGWELVEYEWDEETGEGRFVYENPKFGPDADIVLYRAQPSKPSHLGWKELFK